MITGAIKSQIDQIWNADEQRHTAQPHPRKAEEVAKRRAKLAGVVSARE